MTFRRTRTEWVPAVPVLGRGAYVACISDQAAGKGGVEVATESHYRAQSRKTYSANIPQVAIKHHYFAEFYQR